MEFQFQGERKSLEDTSKAENEYHLDIKIDTLDLTKHQPDDIQLVIIFGDMIHKIAGKDVGGFNGFKQTYIVHSVASLLSEKILNVPIMIYITTLSDLRPLGTILIEVNECFANAISCGDFRSESIRKQNVLTDGKEEFGEIKFSFNVSRNLGNSNRHRRFYTESTEEKNRMEYGYSLTH